MTGQDVEIDSAAVAVDADALGTTGGKLGAVRDDLNGAWSQGSSAFGSSPAAEAFDECSSAWIGAMHTLAYLFDGLGTYTQDIATEFGALDTTMSGWISPTYTTDDLPKKGETRTAPNPGDFA